MVEETKQRNSPTAIRPGILPRIHHLITMGVIKQVHANEFISDVLERELQTPGYRRALEEYDRRKR